MCEAAYTRTVLYSHTITFVVCIAMQTDFLPRLCYLASGR